MKSLLILFRLRRLHNAPQCFTLAQSHQHPKVLTAPVRSMKREGNEDINFVQECNREVTRVCISLTLHRPFIIQPIYYFQVFVLWL